MSKVDERTERLIVRRLDGELNEAERVELDRTILREPEARALLEEYERIDLASSAALALVVDDADGSPAPFPRITAQAAHGGYSRLWWMLPAALAAAVAILVTQQAADPSGHQVVIKPPGQVEEPTVPELTQPVQQAAHRDDFTADVDRLTDRGLLYIVGPDGNVYVIEQERIRTARTPRSLVRRVSGDL